MDPESPKTSAVAGRLARLPLCLAGGIEVPMAASIPARLLGLSHLDRSEAGPGLLIPGCRSVHTFGMRFPLDIVFLDQHGAVLRRCPAVPRRRCLFTKSAHSVLEIVPGGLQGGEVPAPGA